MVGNTTKALTKGFAIATAVIAAVSLYRSFLDTVARARIADDSDCKNIQVNLPDVFIGLLIGGAVPFLFSSFAIRAVSPRGGAAGGRSAPPVPHDPRHLGIHRRGREGQAGLRALRGDLAPRRRRKNCSAPACWPCSRRSSSASGLAPYALGGFLAGAILVGQLMAVFMSNTGGAWDNAKKKIEDGFLGGKGSEAHKAGVIGDTVGDPLKDTAGPALNPMIKVMNLVAILIAPARRCCMERRGGWAMAIISLVILTGAILFSKRGGVVSSRNPTPARCSGSLRRRNGRTSERRLTTKNGRLREGPPVCSFHMVQYFGQSSSFTRSHSRLNILFARSIERTMSSSIFFCLLHHSHLSLLHGSAHRFHKEV